MKLRVKVSFLKIKKISEGPTHKYQIFKFKRANKTLTCGTISILFCLFFPTFSSSISSLSVPPFKSLPFSLWPYHVVPPDLSLSSLFLFLFISFFLLPPRFPPNLFFSGHIWPPCTSLWRKRRSNDHASLGRPSSSVVIHRKPHLEVVAFIVQDVPPLATVSGVLGVKILNSSPSFQGYQLCTVKLAIFLASFRIIWDFNCVFQPKGSHSRWTNFELITHAYTLAMFGEDYGIEFSTIAPTLGMFYKARPKRDARSSKLEIMTQIHPITHFERRFQLARGALSALFSTRRIVLGPW